MKMNLVRDNFKNKFKTWKQAYRMMKDLRNVSGFAWNETTQSVDIDDVVWEELLKQKDFKNARVYKRQPFLYYNDLAIIVGNDIADGSTTAIAQENEDGHLFDEVTDLDNDGGFTTPMDDTPKFEEGFVGMNDSSTSVRQNASTPSSLRGTKKRKTSMAFSLDVICESIQDTREDMRESQIVKVDKGEMKQDISAAFAALKAIGAGAPHQTK